MKKILFVFLVTSFLLLNATSHYTSYVEDYNGEIEGFSKEIVHQHMLRSVTFSRNAKAITGEKNYFKEGYAPLRTYELDQNVLF